MKRLLLILPDGVGVRNYLYSNFVLELQKHNVEVLLYHQLSDGALKEIKKVHPSIVDIKSLPRFVEKVFPRLLRESLAYARLLFNKKKLDNSTVMDFWNGNQKGLKKKLLYRLAELLGTLFSLNYKLILKMEKTYNNEVSKDKIINRINDDLELLKPDLILNLHQRAPISAPIILVANKRKIPTSTVIFSWDNVPKARLISRYDTYFVWSDVMQKELSLLYPEIDLNQIKVTGTPQFEFYFNNNIIQTKETFFSQYGLNPNRKTVCYSANDATSPYEPEYLKDVCEAVAEMEETIRPQILFRRSPTDKSKRFDVVLEKYKEIIFSIDPDWRMDEGSEESFTSIYPSFNDVILLVNTVRHSDLVINFGSTMAHDFAVYDKPCLYLNYNPVHNSKFKVEMAYKFQHFKSMEGLSAVGWINNKSQIVNQIKTALDTPNSIGQDRVTWMQRIAKYPLENSSKNLVNKIIE